MTDSSAPDSFEGVAAVLGAAAAERRAVRIIGAGTKRSWGAHGPQLCESELSTARLDRIYAHNPGDLTAVIGAGVRLSALQAELAAAGQMLALDPPQGESATVGGIFATGDSGPLRHRFGTPRDQILGVTVALSDGSIARSGATVLKNVAGYDLARLFCASFGTLGVILAVTVRLQALPERTATALGLADRPGDLADAAAALAAAPLELRALDVAWRGGRGGLLAQTAGPQAPRRAGRAAGVMGGAGLSGVDVSEQDTDLWARQRAGQRSQRHALVRVSARPSQLPAILELADVCTATLVGRYAAGVSYLELAAGRVGDLRRGLPPGTSAELLDRPSGEPLAGDIEAGARDLTGQRTIALMRAVKDRFDPQDVCNRGISVGGI